MDSFLIVTNDGKDTDQSVTRQVTGLLEASGLLCILFRKDENKNFI